MEHDSHASSNFKDGEKTIIDKEKAKNDSQESQMRNVRHFKESDKAITDKGKAKYDSNANPTKSPRWNRNNTTSRDRKDQKSFDNYSTNANKNYRRTTSKDDYQNTKPNTHLPRINSNTTNASYLSKNSLLSLSKTKSRSASDIYK